DEIKAYLAECLAVSRIVDLRKQVTIRTPVQQQTGITFRNGDYFLAAGFLGIGGEVPEPGIAFLKLKKMGISFEALE
ncbi:MAG: hypothetical protein JNJ90_21165, partial [Saprospiraceae bacterium]|nr:hypothetical protein [Saprospiraceae bacterium]